MKNIFKTIEEKKFIEQLNYYNKLNENYLYQIASLQQKYDVEMKKKNDEIEQLKKQLMKANQKYE